MSIVLHGLLFSIQISFKPIPCILELKRARRLELKEDMTAMTTLVASLVKQTHVLTIVLNDYERNELVLVANTVNDKPLSRIPLSLMNNEKSVIWLYSIEMVQRSHPCQAALPQGV